MYREGAFLSRMFLPPRNENTTIWSDSFFWLVARGTERRITVNIYSSVDEQGEEMLNGLGRWHNWLRPNIFGSCNRPVRGTLYMTGVVVETREYDRSYHGRRANPPMPVMSSSMLNGLEPEQRT